MATDRSGGLNGEMVVSQANQLVEASYTLSVTEKRLLAAAVALIDSRKPLTERSLIKIHAQEFAEIFDLDQRGGQAYKALEEAARKLYNRSIKTIEQGPKGPRERNVRWVWFSEYRKGEGTVTIGFTPALAPYLTQLQEQFTSYRLQNVSNLSTFYSHRLYELFAQFKKTGERRVSLERLRTMLDLGERYQNVRNLRQRVIDPSVKEINAETDLEVSYDALRKGRTITGFQFTIDVNEQRHLPLRPPMDEREARP